MVHSDLNMLFVSIILMLSIIVIQAKNAPIQTTGIVPEESRITRNLDLTLTDEEYSVDQASSPAKLLPRKSRKIDKPHGINRFITHRDHGKQEKILVVTDKVQKEIAPSVVAEPVDDEMMLNWMGSSTYEKLPFFQENKDDDKALPTVTDKVKEVTSQLTLPSETKDDELMLNWMGSSSYAKMPFFQENKNGNEALTAVTDKVEEVALISPSALSSETNGDELMLNWMGSSSYAELPYFQDDEKHELKVRKFKTPNKLGSWVKS